VHHDRNHRSDDRRPRRRQAPVQGEDGGQDPARDVGRAAQGRVHVRLPRRRDPAGVRRAVQDAGQVHPEPPRAGVRPLRRRVRPGDRQARRLHRHQRPGRDEHRHPAGHRPDGLDPDGRVQRAGADEGDRERRVPGGRRHRHHPPVYEVELPGEGHPRAAAGDQRGVPHRHQRPARAGADRPAEGHLGRHADRGGGRHAAGAHHPPPSAGGHAREPRQAGRGRGRDDQPGREAGPVRRRRRDHLQRLAAGPQAGREGEHPLHDHPARHGRVRRAGPQDAAHARHARVGLRELRGAGVRRADRGRGPVRRPGDRQPGQLRPAREDHPHRHRPVVDQQDGRRRLRGRRRRQAEPGADAPAHRAPPAGRVVRPDRPVEAAVPVPVPGRHEEQQAAVRDRGDQPPDQERRDHHDRRRPAPDVGRPVLPVAVPAADDHVRRAGDDGLRPAGRHGRAARQPGQDGDRHRRRRVVPDDLLRAGDDRRVQHPGEGRDPEQRLPGHDQAVAGPVLRAPLQPEPDEEPQLRRHGRGVRHQGHPLRRQDQGPPGRRPDAQPPRPRRGRLRRRAQRARVPHGPQRQGPARDGAGHDGV
ncbi:MAG: Acetolactate synthase large subunit, partial [uncultured Phycisphaerae bacterium]